MKKTDYADIDEPVNFREIETSGIAAGVLYRSGHPLSRSNAVRVKISGLAEKAGIKCVLNLHDPDDVLALSSKDVRWYDTLYKEKKVIALNMDMTIPGADFNKKLKKGLRFMISHDGPYLIHCFAGVDRTGFAAAVLEALMGASLEEIYHDYSLSFNDDDEYLSEQYPGISLCFERGKDDPFIQRQILERLEKMGYNSPITDKNIQAAAEQYLLRGAGLTEREIAALRAVLSSSAV
jgi:hypothetical protein